MNDNFDDAERLGKLLKGQPHHLNGPHLMADNGVIHEELVALFAAMFQGRPPVKLPALPVPA